MDLKNILKAVKLNEGTISMLLGAIVVVVVGILVINYFRGLRTTTTPGSITTEERLTPTLPTEHTVSAGENLWGIAEKYYNSGYNWVDIARENNLLNANLLAVGQTLIIPKVEPKVVQAATSPTVSADISGNAITGDSYTVVRDDNLWNIAVRAYGDGYQWVKIAQANELANPDLIHAGNILNLPR